MVRSCRLPAGGSLSWRRRCWLPGAPRPPPGAQGQGEGEGGGGVVGSKLLQRHQRQEVDRAGLEGLVDCPFCEYATVMEGEADRVLVCRNPDYGRESCRLCRETNHVPLRCDEAEKTEGVRKEIEEKLRLRR